MQAQLGMWSSGCNLSLTAKEVGRLFGYDEAAADLDRVCAEIEDILRRMDILIVPGGPFYTTLSTVCAFDRSPPLV